MMDYTNELMPLVVAFLARDTTRYTLVGLYLAIGLLYWLRCIHSIWWVTPYEAVPAKVVSSIITTLSAPFWLLLCIYFFVESLLVDWEVP